MRTGTAYQGGPKKFSDEGDSVSKGNLIYYIEQDEVAFAQADWFCRYGAESLTQAGLTQINQPIEALVYCVLNACSKQHSGLVTARKGGPRRVPCIG